MAITTPWTNNYRLHSVRFFPDGGSNLVISGMTSGGIQANPEVLAEIASGSIYPTTASLQSLHPVGSFTTFDLESVLGAGGPGINGSNASCIHADTEVGLQMYFAKYECAGIAAASIEHLQYTVAEGVIVPTSLTVDHRGNAQISYDIYMATDAVGTAPVIKADVDLDVANAINRLPGTLANNAKRWTMDKMTIGGVLVAGKRNISLAFNPAVSQDGADSTIFDSVTSLNSFTPRLTVQGVEPDWLKPSTTPPGVTTLSGQTVVAADTVLWLKERNTADGTAAHITLAFNGLLNWDTIITGDATSPSQTTLAIDVTKPGVADAIVALTGQVIT